MVPHSLFDVHTHAQFAAFADDAGAVIQRALDAGVWMVNVGTQADTSKKAIELAKKYPEGVYATVGLHPIHTERSYHDKQELGGTGKEFESREEEFNYEYYKNLSRYEKVVAIGECGLDYYRLSKDTREKQRDAFEKQIQLSADVHKPLMIHCRQAFTDLIEILKTHNHTLNAGNSGIIHFFSGTMDDARTLLQLGFSFSFGGVLTFTSDYHEVVRYIPLDRIVLETDAPYVAPVPYRGKRNEPIYVREVAKKLAEVKNTDFETVAAQTFQNAKSIFGI